MGWAFAQNPADEWFNQANAAYNSGNYNDAVELYQKILDSDMESVPVYYNMGIYCVDFGSATHSRYTPCWAQLNFPVIMIAPYQ